MTAYSLRGRFASREKLRVNIDAYEILCTLWNPADE
jgi:hypothetical protein